jgi:glycosyltransferase involved in cell wall biosynthesis
MNLVATVQQRYERTPDGAIWCKQGKAYNYWSKMLEVFGHVKVIARVKDVAQVPDGGHRADGDGVSFTAVPYYVGPAEYLRNARGVRRAACGAICDEDAVVMHAGTELAAALEPEFSKRNRPYGVIVVGDPDEVFAPKSVKHLLRPVFRWWFTYRQQVDCFNACAALYVTEKTLQSKYPCPQHSVSATDVELPEEAIVSSPRVFALVQTHFELVTVGTMEQRYKAHDVLIDAVAMCIEDGFDIKLTLIGDGKHRKELEAQALRKGIGDRVLFTGTVPSGKEVRNWLDKSDLFILPSRTEGLPRAMIEAMARALPCIGSDVGGIPELLDEKDLVPSADTLALADKITEVLTAPERLTIMSARNLEKARFFRDAVTKERRVSFYRFVEEETRKWLKTSRGGDYESGRYN